VNIWEWLLSIMIAMAHNSEGRSYRDWLWMLFCRQQVSDANAYFIIDSDKKMN
jgi:hypothetical protein